MTCAPVVGAYVQAPAGSSQHRRVPWKRVWLMSSKIRQGVSLPRLFLCMASAVDSSFRFPLQTELESTLSPVDQNASSRLQLRQVLARIQCGFILAVYTIKWPVFFRVDGIEMPALVIEEISVK